ncbi:hypothetical protein CLF_108602 [Clonorchis sinensis]|uniref:Uncharacterized protein n=1 Tax=Clonorchis sinensis TaxID=79923 RepID=G7YI94_CLOSI|nr:hypothetical protein CLF_108602 [Clonorchis sinensis]
MWAVFLAVSGMVAPIRSDRNGYFGCGRISCRTCDCDLCFMWFVCDEFSVDWMLYFGSSTERDLAGFRAFSMCDDISTRLLCVRVCLSMYSALACEVIMMCVLDFHRLMNLLVAVFFSATVITVDCGLYWLCVVCLRGDDILVLALFAFLSSGFFGVEFPVALLLCSGRHSVVPLANSRYGYVRVYTFEDAGGSGILELRLMLLGLTTDLYAPLFCFNFNASNNVFNHGSRYGVTVVHKDPSFSPMGLLKQAVCYLYNVVVGWTPLPEYAKCIYMTSRGDSANPFAVHDENGPEDITGIDAKMYSGIWISSNMFFSLHYEKSAPKAFAVIRMIWRTFPRITRMTFRTLYRTFGRPLLEYANNVVYSRRNKEMLTVERVQRAVTKMVADPKSVD